jgi:hypothetical protein
MNVATGELIAERFTEELRQKINNAGFSDEFKRQIKSAQKKEGRKMFERLTHRSKYDIAYTKIPANPSNMVDIGECYTGRIIDRLAAYEDTGLTPEQIEAQQQEIDRLKHHKDKIDFDIEKSPNM